MWLMIYRSTAKFMKWYEYKFTTQRYLEEVNKDKKVKELTDRKLTLLY